MEHLWQRLRIKAILCWGVALALFKAEIIIHVKFGFSKKVLESEEAQCLGIPFWDDIPTEALCHVGVAVMIAGMLYEIVIAAKRNDVAGYLHSSFIGENPCIGITTMAFGCITMAFGFYNLCRNQERIPAWTWLYLHVVEAFCATIILTCLTGILCDFCSAFAAGKTFIFLGGLASCTDSLDDHGITACKDHDDHDDSEPVDLLRAAILWIVFVVTVIMIVTDENKENGYISRSRAIFAVVCSGGIAMAIVRGLCNFEGLMIVAVSGKSMGSMLPQYNPSEPLEKKRLISPA
jgi:hypothetical protein